MPKVPLKNISIDNIVYPVGYKVVTSDMRSLGLRHNPNIITYPVNEWLYLPEEQLKRGMGDWGGIWVCRTESGARAVSKYMMRKHSVDTRIFKALLDDILYANSYRVKTNGVFLLEELAASLIRC